MCESITLDFLKATTEPVTMDGASQWRDKEVLNSIDKEVLDSISICGDTLMHSNLIISAPNPPFKQHLFINLQ